MRQRAAFPNARAFGGAWSQRCSGYRKTCPTASPRGMLSPRRLLHTTFLVNLEVAIPSFPIYLAFYVPTAISSKRSRKRVQRKAVYPNFHFKMLKHARQASLLSVPALDWPFPGSWLLSGSFSTPCAGRPVVRALSAGLLPRHGESMLQPLPKGECVAGAFGESSHTLRSFNLLPRGSF